MSNHHSAARMTIAKLVLQRLLKQCTNSGIPELPASTTDEAIPSLKSAFLQSDIILDAIFGFSFSPPCRPPFDAVLQLIAGSNLPIVSVDIPSGWDVEKGKISFSVKDVDGQAQETEFSGLEPDVLVSLTAPKLGVKEFKGRHFLGGRFVNKYVLDTLNSRHGLTSVISSFDEQFQLNIPEYPGSDQVVELPSNGESPRL